ncbi:hypothetical protein T484DRAFT_1884734, partial [Baffinella frigidus]
MTGTEERERKTGISAVSHLVYLTDDEANTDVDLTQDIDVDPLPAMKRRCADSVPCVCAPGKGKASEGKQAANVGSKMTCEQDDEQDDEDDALASTMHVSSTDGYVDSSMGKLKRPEEERDMNDWAGTPWARAGAGRVHLSQESQEFKAAFKAFHRTCPEGSFVILGIERINNKRLSQSFELLKEEMEEVNGPTGAGDMQLFHGTSWDVAEKMASASCSSFFNRSFAGRNGSAFGQGCYFARSTLYADRYAHPSPDGVCYMFSANVLTGKTHQ